MQGFASIVGLITVLCELPHRDEGYNVKELLATFKIVDLKKDGCDAMELHEAGADKINC